MLISLLHFYSRPCGRGDEKGRRERETGHISTHAPAGGATLTHTRLPFTSTFLLTPLREGRHQRQQHIVLDLPFLLTPLREGRLIVNDEKQIVMEISTHAPAGGATAANRLVEQGSFDFYSRPCGRGDAGLRHGQRTRSTISTHAPAGGATLRRFRECEHQGISTHAPAGGATNWGGTIKRAASISTHAPAGGATGFSWLEGTIRLYISTHAPAGGAT